MNQVLYTKSVISYGALITLRLDVIEFRFFTLDENRQLKLPKVTFSVLYGCYFTFFPQLWDNRLVYQIENILTPREVHCHFRSKAKRTIAQQPNNLDKSLWHLNETKEKQNTILADVYYQIINEILPTLDGLE